jgi:hypothetical protein
MNSTLHKLKTCHGCGEERKIWKSDGRMKYCQECWKKIKAERTGPTLPTERQRIKPVSDKQSKLNAGYAKLRKVFFSDPKNLSCKAQLHGCTYDATDVHHKKGRGIYLIDISTWLAVCRSCHHWIEENPEEAKNLGLSESRLKNSFYDVT